MLRSIRNIFFATAATIIICSLVYSLIYEDVPVELPVVMLMFGGMLSIVAWALGLTRLSSARMRERSNTVISYVEQAVRLNLPLPRMLIAAEASEPRWIAGRIGSMRKQLDKGSSITDALRKAVPGTSRRALALVGAAERMGRIGPELTRLVRDEQDRQSRNIAERSFLRRYPVAMIVVILFILTLVMTFVMPKFQQIFADFRIPLPPLTREVIQLTGFQNDLAWLFMAIGAGTAAAIAQQLRRRLNWLTPLRFFATSQDLADICHIISGELEAGLPLNTAIRGARELAIGRWLRQKLLHWADGIEQGLPPKDAAHIAGMPDLIAGLTTTADGFEFLSRYYAGKFSRLMILLHAAAIPIMVFIFGVIVAIVALTLFLPLVALIDSVSPGTGPNSGWL